MHNLFPSILLVGTIRPSGWLMEPNPAISRLLLHGVGRVLRQRGFPLQEPSTEAAPVLVKDLCPIRGSLSSRWKNTWHPETSFRTGPQKRPKVNMSVISYQFMSCYCYHTHERYLWLFMIFKDTVLKINYDKCEYLEHSRRIHNRKVKPNRPTNKNIWVAGEHQTNNGTVPCDKALSKGLKPLHLTESSTSLDLGLVGS